MRRRDPGAGVSGRRALAPFRSPSHPGLRQFLTRNYGRLASRLRRLTTGQHQLGQAPGGAVMPGYAAAQPGTGQTAPAIIAPASCRHDNCNSRCLIIAIIRPCLFACCRRLDPFGALQRRPPASACRNPAGSALHNKTLCKLARADAAPNAAKAATALKRHTTRVLLTWAALRQLRRLAPAQLSESPCGLSAGRNNARLPGRVPISYHPLALSDSLRYQSFHRRTAGHWVACRKRFQTGDFKKQDGAIPPPAPRGLL